MKYIHQPDGSYFALEEESELFQRLQTLPDERRPVFLSEDDQGVADFLSSQPSPFDAEIAAARVELLRIFSMLRERVAKSSHYLQSSRWPVQLAAAEDILANGELANELNKNMLDLEARLRARGESRQDLANKVIKNSLVFTMVGAAIDGIETAALDAIHTAIDSERIKQVIQEAPVTASREIMDILTPALGQEAAAASVQSLFAEI